MFKRATKGQELGGVLPISFEENGSRVKWSHVGEMLRLRKSLGRGSLHGGEERDHKAMSSLLKIYNFCFYHFLMILLII